MIAVVDDSDTVLGAGRIRPYEQAWGGRHLRMGGVAGVYVEPSVRPDDARYGEAVVREELGAEFIEEIVLDGPDGVR